MRLVNRMVLLVGGALSLAITAQAQYAQNHQGMYATVGLAAAGECCLSRLGVT